jgi:hypothetical protein
MGPRNLGTAAPPDTRRDPRSERFVGPLDDQAKSFAASTQATKGNKAFHAPSPKRLEGPGTPILLHTTYDRGCGQQSQGVAGKKAADKQGAVTLTVRDSHGDAGDPEVAALWRPCARYDRRSRQRRRRAGPRICAPHGLSPAERKLLAEAMHWLRGIGLGAFISVDGGRSPDAERMVRGLVRRLRSDLVQRQRRAGMRSGLLVTVFEALGRDGRPKFNAHVIAIMPDADARDRLIESLHRSSVYTGRADVRPVDDWSRLTAYLLKEATPQAWFGAGKSFRRIKGSIPLGDLGGDRVVLSLDLKAALIDARRIEPYRRSYAKRLPKAPAVRQLAHSKESGP